MLCPIFCGGCGSKLGQIDLTEQGEHLLRVWHPAGDNITEEDPFVVELLDDDELVDVTCIRHGVTFCAPERIRRAITEAMAEKSPRWVIHPHG